MVQLGEEKMSKSLGNLITIREALEKYSADAIRVFVLGSYYRSPLTYTEASLEAAERGVERLLRVVSRDDPTGGKGQALDARPYEEQFKKAMDDDFNTPQALGVLFDLAREINQAGDAGTSFSEAQSTLKRLAGNVLGLKLELSEFLIEEPDSEEQRRVNQLIEERNMLRKAKQWEKADKIRAGLAEQGIILEDTPRGTIVIWKRKR
jgi:cysteinyl-tRNA synthetase